MRGFVLILVVVVLGAGALSVLILPSRHELGTMHLRDRRYEESRAIFEQQIADGDLSPQTVSALLSIYLQYGDVQRAIDLTERYEAAIGRSPDVLTRLAELYAADQRLGLHRKFLRQLVDIDPTPARLEGLADAYLRAGLHAERHAVLKRLADGPEASDERVREFAELSTTLGHLDDALSAYLSLADRQPGVLDWSERALTAQLLLRAGRDAEALRLTKRWLDGSEPQALRIAFAQVWAEAGRNREAVGLLDDRRELEAVSESWRAVYVLALQRDGRADEAFLRLAGWLDRGWLTPVLAVEYVGLATTRSRFDRAIRVLEEFGVELFPTPVIAGLVSALQQAGRAAEVDRMIAAIGPERMAELPILAAEIAIARGRRIEAREWVDIALSRRMLSADDRLALAPILIELGDDARALELLKPLAAGSSMPIEAAVLIGELYARSGDAENAYWEVNALLARRYTPQLRAVWAQLALSTGRDVEVRDWLNLTKEIGRQTLDNLYFIAERRQSWDIAVRAARRMLEASPSDESRERLAFALLRSGDAAQALDAYDGIDNPAQSTEGMYVEILSALGLTDRLVALWQRQIERPDISRDRLHELIYNLLDVGADSVAWPYMVEVATSEGDSWWFALADSAVRIGRGDQAAGLIASEIDGLAANDENISSLLAALEIAAPDRSLEVFRRLANRSPSIWADSYAIALRDRGLIEELNAWLSEQLEASRDSSEALVLAQRLAETAKPLDAARVIRPRAGENRSWAELYVTLLRRGDRPGQALKFLIEMATTGRLAPQWRREIAFQALEAGNRKAADRLFRAIARSEPPDGPSVQQLFFLWGPRPEPAALDWIEARARASKGSERKAWLERLLSVRAGDRVVSIIGDVEGAADASEVELVVRARAQGREPERLREAVAAAVDRTRDVDALVRFAETAETTRDRKLVIDAWSAVLAVDSRHAKANRELGLIAYDEGRLVDAEHHLQAFLSNGDGDYEANYFLGEVLFRTGRKSRAGPYYEKAYAQLIALSATDFYRKVAKANILRRLGRLDDAAAVMSDLLEERPRDRGLRADYADLLIEKGDFARARYVLQLR